MPSDSPARADRSGTPARAGESLGPGPRQPPCPGRAHEVDQKLDGTRHGQAPEPRETSAPPRLEVSGAPIIGSETPSGEGCLPIAGSERTHSRVQGGRAPRRTCAEAVREAPMTRAVRRRTRGGWHRAGPAPTVAAPSGAPRRGGDCRSITGSPTRTLALGCSPAAPEPPSVAAPRTVRSPASPIGSEPGVAWGLGAPYTAAASACPRRIHLCIVV